jgi:hypothetical protein
MRTRTGLLTILALAAAIAAPARDKQPPELMVCFEGHGDVPLAVLQGAQLTTDVIFAGAGVRIAWHGCGSKLAPAGDPWVVQVRFARTPPNHVHPTALGYAQPFGDGKYAITLLYPRIAGLVPLGGGKEPAILGHVLAHEIGHVLQAIDRHSASGVMKAHWAGADIRGMSGRPLAFTPHDIDLIRRGLDARKARADATVRAARAPGEFPW